MIKKFSLRNKNGDSTFAVIFAIVILIMLLLIVHKVNKYLDENPDVLAKNTSTETTDEVENNQGNTSTEKGDSNSSNKNSRVNNSTNTSSNNSQNNGISWEGVYSSGDIKIVISCIDDEKIILNISEDEELWSKEIELTNNLSISYEDSEEKIQINKTEEGIYVEATSADENSLLNNLENNYKKVEN